jgi:hypothetical protein
LRGGALLGAVSAVIYILKFEKCEDDLKKIANPKPISRECVLAAQEAYDKFMSIAKFSF